jgi:hypothetical protein
VAKAEGSQQRLPLCSPHTQNTGRQSTPATSRVGKEGLPPRDRGWYLFAFMDSWL